MNAIEPMVMTIPAKRMALVYDLEIIKMIPDRNGERINGFDYCAGWNDHANMGISVIGAYDELEDRYRVFCQDNWREFMLLAEMRYPLVSFNGLNFDNRVLAAHGLAVKSDRCYDILDDIWHTLGGFQKGYGLDACAKVNFGEQKLGDGAYAPMLWQQGRVGEVIDYCLNDVKLTWKLYQRICEEGRILHPVHDGAFLELEGPREATALVRDRR